jgi:glycosyltransferase involved in cell wall biosynthesis
MKINVILPHVTRKPGGGTRVMYEYANYLSKMGYDVNVYSCHETSFFEDSGLKKILKLIYFLFVKFPNWFSFEKAVSSKIINKVCNDSLKDGDVIFSTGWSVCYDIAKLSKSKGKHFNLIQDIENWTGDSGNVRKSYTISNAENVVIAKYLYEYIGKVTGKFPSKVSFAIDNSKYKVIVPIKERFEDKICMLYSLEPRKGSVHGLNALKLLKDKNKDLGAVLFGVQPRPADLPEWIEYYENYKNIPELYNSCSIFLGPSNQEGCALPPMEAMYCGCAVVCTNIDGHKDYAYDNETAILAHPADPVDIANKIQGFLDDRTLRIKIAEQGNKYVSQFTWENSTKELDEIFIKNL